MLDIIFIKKLIILLALLIGVFLLLSLWGLYTAIRPPKILSPITPKDLGLDYEEIYFETEDNLKLKGWFIPAQIQTKKTIIGLHGYPADKGNILPFLAFLNKNYNIFLFDFRYLGESQGAYTTAGASEVKDLKAAIKFLKSRGIKEIGIWGFSMGGAVALMESSNRKEIKAIISEASYASLAPFAQELYPIPGLKIIFGKLIIFWAKLFLSINIQDITPAKNAQNIKIPVLLIHSQSDYTIPFQNALLIQKSLKENKQAEFFFPQNLIHGQFSQNHKTIVENFFKKNL